MTTATGLDNLLHDNTLQRRFRGNVAYLCHNASVDSRCREGLACMKEIFGSRLVAVFSPQHGLFSEAQDNMIESGHFLHPFFKIPVFSLYSETRSPTAEMLHGIDHVFVDLQDVGCRAYTFVYTMTLMMAACARQGIEVVVLDRPNPLGGLEVEGNVLEEAFRSFIGLHPLPMRHGLTIGEIARLATRFWGIECPLLVVPLTGWRRSMQFGQTKLPWVFPSPNMPHPKTAQVFPGTVLFEGTNFSEGRGTTRPFELFGHPELKPHELLAPLERVFEKNELGGFILRPVYFQPTFDKHTGVTCGGFQLHVMERRQFKPWHTGQVLLRELRHALGVAFQWRKPPFEYEENLLPIDILNGSDQPRIWVEENGNYDALKALEKKGADVFLNKRVDALLYPL
jgi:uncharacterized protein YbbC (DUF1343 family)